MKVSLVYVLSSRESWAEEATQLYHKKLSPFCDFQLMSVKSPALDRTDNEEKREKEGERIIKVLDPRALTILLDEKGKTAKDSRAWSQSFQKKIEQGKPLQFIIGGAYGASSAVKEKAHETWTLSPLTFNHHLARVVFLEQIYRTYTIIKNIPYHN